VAEYNSKQVAVTFGGVEIVGFGEDTMVSWEWDTEFTTDKVSVDGTVTASKTNDYRGTVTFTLMSTSPSNAVLAGFAASRKFGPGSIGTTDLHVQDNLSGEEISSTNAWVLVPPSGEFGSEVSEREWQIRCADLSYVHAGLQPA
jgi:hypothetical protein